PVNVTIPVVTGDASTTGNLMTTTDGTWTQSPTSFTYRWLRDDVAISGSTASTYTTQVADDGTVLKSEVTAINGAGSSLPETSVGTAIGSEVPVQLLVEAWFDFSDATKLVEGATSLDIAGWINSGLGGSTYDLVQGTGANQPKYLLNGVNGLNVANWGLVTNTKSLVATGSGDNWQDVYVICRYDGGTDWSSSFQGLFTADVSTVGVTGIGIIANNSGSKNLFTGSNWWDNLFINNVSVLETADVLPTLNSLTMLSVSANSPVSEDGIVIGNDRDDIISRGFQGVICEVLAFNYALNTTERNTLNSYVQAKWGTP
ncbi:MAG: hypothetical protein V3U78_10005, partial [Thiotrichaceae bacterium]